MGQVSRRSVLAVALAAGAATMAGAGGCQQQQKQSTKVPQGAKQVAQVQAQPLTWTADRTGTIYVVDVPDDTLIYRGTVRTGQMLVVDPQVKRVSIDGRTVSEGKFKSGHRNAVYLQQGAVTPERREPSNRVGEAQ